MNGAFEIAGIGLESQQRALEIIANNIANINTPGFKRTDVRFSAMIAAQPDPSNPSANLAQGFASSGVSADAVLALNEQGEIERTGDPMQIAIDGEGFIELMGARGQSMLWRGGALSINADGLLSASGLPLKAMINVPADAHELSIAANGAVTALMPGGAAPVMLGQINLVRINDLGAVEAADGGLYRVRDAAQLDDMTPSEDGAGSLVQGALEHSNVELNDEMIQLMILQRAFASNAQVVQAADQIMALANNMRK